MKVKVHKDLLMYPCPKCDQRVKFSYNFCPYCCFLLNPEGYFNFLANFKKKEDE